MLEDIFKSRNSVIFLSIIWGLGTAMIFKRNCDGRNCKIVVTHGPNPADVQKTFFNYGTDKCYRYSPYIAECK